MGHTGATIKLNTGKSVFIDMGQFYYLKEGERAVKIKYLGFTKFSKI